MPQLATSASLGALGDPSGHLGTLMTRAALPAEAYQGCGARLEHTRQVLSALQDSLTLGRTCIAAITAEY